MNSSLRIGTRCAALAAVLGTLLGGSIATAGDAPVATPTAVRSAAPVVVPAGKPLQRVGRPVRLTIAAIGVREGLYGVGLEPDGAMATPAFGDAGWYDRGPRPGAPGPAVVVAHVHGPAGDDVFARLHELRAGDIVRVAHTRGTATFVVDKVEQAAKDALPYDRIWPKTRQRLLRLITCGGIPDPVTRMYPDNTIVYAHRVA